MSEPIAEKPKHVAPKRKFDSSSSTSSSTKHADKKWKGAGSDKKQPWKKGGSDKKKPIALTKKDRELKKKERKAAKPNADIIAEANKIWQTSFTQIGAAERSQHISSLLTHMKGKMHEVGLKHDASRAIQLALKYASEDQKRIIIQELTGHFKQLSEEHYGHYIIIKLLSNDTRKGEAKKLCLKEFKTHINKLSMQPDSAKVLDYLFASSPRKDQNSILQEFYSPEFVVFSEDEGIKDKTLTEILLAKPEKKNQILENIRKYLDKSFEKNMIMFRFIHALLLQYLTHASLSDDTSKEFLPNLYQYIPALHHSVDGCRIICHMLSVGTSAKDRKNILKFFKGLVCNMAERQEGVWVLTCALDVVDDTVLLEKVIFAELLPALKDQLSHQYSSRIYMHILNSHAAAIFSPEEQENYSISAKWILSPSNSPDAPATAKSSASSSSSTPATPLLSKKDPSIKRLELLSCFLLPLLTTYSTLPDVFSTALRSNVGHHLLLEAIKETWRLIHDPEAKKAASAAPAAPAATGKKKGKGAAAAVVKTEEDGDVKMDGGEDGDAEGESAAASATGAPANRFPASLAKKLSQLSTQLDFNFTSLLSECKAPLFDGSSSAASVALKGSKSNPLEDRFGHYVLKRLLTTLQPAPETFLTQFLDTIQPNLSELVLINRPAFVISAVLEKEIEVSKSSESDANEKKIWKSLGDRLRKELKPFLKQIIAASGSKPVAPVAMDESKDEDASAKKPFAKKNAPVYNAHSTTNAGVELLSKLLQGLPTERTAAASATNGKAASKSVASPSLTAATPAKPAKSTVAAKSTAKKGKKDAEVVKMEVDEEPATTTKTPAKKPAASAKKSTKKKKGDEMEE